MTRCTRSDAVPGAGRRVPAPRGVPRARAALPQGRERLESRGPNNSKGTRVKGSRRFAWAQATSAGLLLSWAAGCLADPPAGAQNGAGDGGQVSQIKGGFLSTFTQAFKEDFDREDIRGHFDTGTPTHRYYCLFDPKTGRNQPNAVAGEPAPRRDGTTGIKGAAVSPLSCADAEQKGILVTTGYVLKGGKSAASAAGAAPAIAPAAAPAAVPAPPPTPPAAAMVPPAAPAAAIESAVQSEVMAAYGRFISAQNAHDRAAVAATLLDSNDFVWAHSTGSSVWGSSQALDALEHEWHGIWKLDPQLAESRVASLAPGVALLIVPVLFTAAAPGNTPAMVPIRWAGVFVRTSGGWRIASVLITPFRDWRAPSG